MHEFFEISGVVFWSYIGTSIVFSHPRQKELWKIFFGDLEIDITIVSFEETIIFWIVSFDKIIF
jgi:hypothetical protein